jgi:hypothetical protein
MDGQSMVTPWSLASAMCNVRSLHLGSRLQLWHIESKGAFPWVHSLQSIETLHLRGIRIDSWHELLSLPLPRLEHLSLDNTLYRRTSSLTLLRGAPTAVSLPAHALTVSDSETRHLPALLALLPTIERLNTPVDGLLHVKAAVPPTLCAVHVRVLRGTSCKYSLRCSLHVLRLIPQPAMQWPDALEPQLAAQLEVLEITFEHGAQSPALLALLFQNGTHLPRLRRIYATFLGPVDMSPDDGETLADVLVGVRAPKLTRVELAASYRGAENAEKYLAFLCGLFASAWQRGILHVQLLD